MSQPSAVAPHPTLERYYAAAEEKRGFVRHIFNNTAGHYNRVEGMMALGTGPWYRRHALRRAGLQHGMRVLDVATGTGLVAREAIGIVGSPGRVMGIDPSRGMLAEAVRMLGLPAVLGSGEQLPVADRSFDFLSMGYALRHLSDLSAAFGEFFRVLKPGGRICLLEISRPAGKVGLAVLRGYMKSVVPLLTRFATRHQETRRLWEYYWDTIETCVAPESVLAVLRQAGFRDVKRHVQLGVFSEYTAVKAA